MKLLLVHIVKWLSVGQVMMRFADILLVLLTLFRPYVYFILYLMFELLGYISSNMNTWSMYFEFIHIWLL